MKLTRRILTFSLTLLPYAVAIAAFYVVSERSCCNANQIQMQQEEANRLANRLRVLEAGLLAGFEIKRIPADHEWQEFFLNSDGVIQH